MTILITGANGLIGAALAAKLKGNQAVICQSRSPQPPASGISWIKHDLLQDSWENLALPNLDIVYHLAGQTSAYAARTDPVADLSVNVLSLLRLLEYLRGRSKPVFVVFAGTATEVGMPEHLPLNEELCDKPVTFYDISKLSAELYLKQYIREGWISGCVLRLGNVFGGSRSGQRRDRGILDKVFLQALSGKNVRIYGAGDQLRDYVYIDDVVSALLLAPLHAERTNGQTYLIGTGKGITLKSAFAKVIAIAGRISGTQVEMEHVEPPPGLLEIELRNAVIDASAYTKATGWCALRDFDEGLAVAYQDFILNR